MNYPTKLVRAAERVYLSARIILERPDLVGKKFSVQLETFRRDAVEDFVKAEMAYNELDEDQQQEAKKPEPSPLLERAFGCDADQSIGFYRAGYELNKERIYRTRELNTELHCIHTDLILDNIGLRSVAREAVDIATNAVGQQARSN